MMVYELAVGSQVEPLTQTWAAFSSISGDTLQLNDEAAAILEVLALGPADEAKVCSDLAGDSNSEPDRVAEAIRHAWDQLLEAGLVRRVAIDAHNHE